MADWNVDPSSVIADYIYQAYQQSVPYYHESTTSVVVNSAPSRENPSDARNLLVDVQLAARAWEHARIRSENGCVFLTSMHERSPSLLEPFCNQIPFGNRLSLLPAIEAGIGLVRAFTNCATPFNPSYPRYSSLAIAFDMTTDGNAISAQFKLPQDALDLQSGLLNIPDQTGFRAFNVFYYLHNPKSTKTERELLRLKSYASYNLLNRSETYEPLPQFGCDDGDEIKALRDRLRLFGCLEVLVSLSGLLTLGNAIHENNEETRNNICADAAYLLDIPVEHLVQLASHGALPSFIGAVYAGIVDYVLLRINHFITEEIAPRTLDGAIAITAPEDSVTLSVIDIPDPSLAQAVATRVVFDDEAGINGEMRNDGVMIPPAPGAVRLAISDGSKKHSFDLALNAHDAAFTDRSRAEDISDRHALLTGVALHTPSDSFLSKALNVELEDPYKIIEIAESSRVWFQLSMSASDSITPSASIPWSLQHVVDQVSSFFLPDWMERRFEKLDFTADYTWDELPIVLAPLQCPSTEGPAAIQNWILSRGWPQSQMVCGRERLWVREPVFEQINRELLSPPTSQFGMLPHVGDSNIFSSPFGDGPGTASASVEDLKRSYDNASSRANPQSNMNGHYGLGAKGDPSHGIVQAPSDDDLIALPTSRARRVWVSVTWALTFWIPSFLLSSVGRMKRPDVRMAWREKVALVLIILFINATIVFYIIGFGRLLCPNFDKAWNRQEVSTHQGRDDFWVSHSGHVYDLSKFWRLQHSDSPIKTTTDNMEPFAGADMDPYIRPPLNLACSGLVSNEALVLQLNTTQLYPAANHVSGTFFQTDRTTALHSTTWYTDKFLPRMKEYYKGDLVWTRKQIAADGDSFNRPWVIIDKSVYDLTDYFHTLDLFNNRDPRYAFLDPEVSRLIKDNPGTDITNQWKSNLNSTTRADHLRCLNNYFYVGKLDFRKDAQCTVNSYILLAAAIILATVIVIKFLAALQLGSKRKPTPQDKFVICQVPAYTEGEDQLRKGLDSLTALEYDNKRKLILVICDGLLIGQGNDRPTPKIVLDILGVDPKTDPPALPFESIGTGNERLNYGKVYSGLYECDGHVVPYIVVVKVGKQSEQQKPKPGNRGKRDSQVLLMRFLNRVHHGDPMSPLELEMFHQLNNVIGVDPELYEYILMVDADTMVKEDSLNRLVASCANDAKIAGICGETRLENEERSWWTMIQVYEYYISHHLSKAFESLFGSVTCLPGCFSMYRIRTPDKGRPLIISGKVITEYADPQVDTLHKKNLLSLGEDRYLTTLMTKHFPEMSYKFIPDAYANTAAPETWSILLSQRRRWINSTIHNLAELMFLKDLCGFCCFSMRFVVFIDLFGTIILPATCTYLGYLIYTVASGTGPIPYISLAMLAGVYGLQAVIFIVKRQWQHIGWMIIYIIAFPIFSFVLPLYSFWKQDDFSWGNTRRVITEKGQTKLVTADEEKFDPASIPLQTWLDYSEQNNLPGRRGPDLADDKSQYSSEPFGSVYDQMPGPGRMSAYSQLPHPMPTASFYGTPAHLSASHLSTYQPMLGSNSVYDVGLSSDNLRGGAPSVGRGSIVPLDTFHSYDSQTRFDTHPTQPR